MTAWKALPLRSKRVREAMGLRSGEKAHVISYRNRIEIIPVRRVRKHRGYLKGINTSLAREGVQTLT